MRDTPHHQTGFAVAGESSFTGNEGLYRGTGKSRLMMRLLGAAAGVSLLAGMGVSAQAQTADVDKIQSQLNALTAQVKALKAELRKQAHEQKETKVKIRAVERRELAVVRAPYEPPFFADKALHLGPVTLTPGGFIAGEGVFRQRADQADIATAFGALPFPNQPIYHMNETRFSARQSRPSLLAQAEIAPGMIASAYFEMDFLGAAQTASAGESNSYNPRIRNLYVSLDWAQPGVSVLAGQAWTLMMLQGKGLDPRNIVTAPFIDADFIPGQLWERGAQVRFVKDLGPFTVGVSAENPQTTFASCPGATNGTTTLPIAGGAFGQLPNGVDVFCESQGGLFYNSLVNYSLNRIPDIVGKAAWDGKVADRNVHLEAMGYFSEEYDQVAYGGILNTSTGLVSGYTPGGNMTTDAWGVGGGVVATLIPKWLDTEDQVFAGRGIGRFGTSLLPDATFNPDGSVSAIPEVMFLGSLTAHITPQIDIWGGGGFEREFGNYWATGSSYYGVGVPNANNSGCYIEGGTCAGATKEVWQATGGLWYKIYSGMAGTVRWGMQYSYTQRVLFAGSGASSGSSPLVGSPVTSDNIVLTSLRWYPFDMPAVSPPLQAKY